MADAVPVGPLAGTCRLSGRSLHPINTVQEEAVMSPKGQRVLARTRWLHALEGTLILTRNAT